MGISLATWRELLHAARQDKEASDAELAHARVRLQELQAAREAVVAGKLDLALVPATTSVPDLHGEHQSLSAYACRQIALHAMCRTGSNVLPCRLARPYEETTTCRRIKAHAHRCRHPRVLHTHGAADCCTWLPAGPGPPPHRRSACMQIPMPAVQWQRGPPRRYAVSRRLQWQQPVIRKLRTCCCVRPRTISSAPTGIQCASRVLMECVCPHACALPTGTHIPKRFRVISPPARACMPS